MSGTAADPGRVVAVDDAPGALSLYPRIVGGAVAGPLARALPPLGVLGRHLPLAGAAGRSSLPDLEVRQDDVVADAARVAAYCRLLGLRVRDALPATYPYVLAFGLQTRLMADAGFPLPVLGLVHVRNRIVQRRALRVGEPFALSVRATDLGPHARGTQLTVALRASVAGEEAWSAEAVYLRVGARPGGAGGAPPPAGPADPDPDAAAEAVWRLAGDFGRRYAGVSGDRNPIHLHPLTARAFGMPRPIAHGMAVKARCLGALEADLPEAVELDVRFRRPVALPATVAFVSAADGAERHFGVRGARDGEPHLAGVARPL